MALDTDIGNFSTFLISVPYIPIHPLFSHSFPQLFSLSSYSCSHTPELCCPLIFSLPSLFLIYHLQRMLFYSIYIFIFSYVDVLHARMLPNAPQTGPHPPHEEGSLPSSNRTIREITASDHVFGGSPDRA